MNRLIVTVVAAVMLAGLFGMSPAEAAPAVKVRSAAASKVARQVKATHGAGIAVSSCVAGEARAAARRAAGAGKVSGRTVKTARSGATGRCGMRHARVIAWSIKSASSSAAVQKARAKVRRTSAVKSSRWTRTGVGVASKGKRWVVVVVLAEAKKASSNPSPAPPTPPSDSEVRTLAREVLAEANAARAGAGVGQLAWSTCLEQNAQNWAEHLVPVINGRSSLYLNGATDHRPQTDTAALAASCVPPVVRPYGTFSGLVGDIIVCVPAVVTPVAGEAVRAWLNSAGHRAWLLDPDATAATVNVAWSDRHEAFIVVMDLAVSPFDPGPPPP